jgi:hypothetical protein
MTSATIPLKSRFAALHSSFALYLRTVHISCRLFLELLPHRSLPIRAIRPILRVSIDRIAKGKPMDQTLGTLDGPLACKCRAFSMTSLDHSGSGSCSEELWDSVTEAPYNLPREIYNVNKTSNLRQEYNCGSGLLSLYCRRTDVASACPLCVLKGTRTDASAYHLP